MLTMPRQQSTRLRHGFAPDPALPSRDALLDPDSVQERLSTILGRSGPLDIEGCALVRAKYRIGESLRVVYRLQIGGTSQLVAARAFRDGASAAALRCCDELVAAGQLRPIAHDPSLDCVWWSFPNDRRLGNISALLTPTPDLAALLVGVPRWTSSELVEYAPERSVTLRAVGADGTASAYVKAYAPGSTDLPALARRYAMVARALNRSPVSVCSPEPLWWSDAHHALLMQALPGRQWDQLPARSTAPALRRLGRAIAALHGSTFVTESATMTGPLTLPFSRFRRLDRARVVHSAELVGRARPDLAAAARRLAEALSENQPAADPDVLLHGDCHPKNALLHGEQVALLDLDQAGFGPAAADIGSLLARLEHARIVDDSDSNCTTNSHTETGTVDLAAAFLDGYADIRPLPDPASLLWHTSAALLAERAMRAVNRVRPEALSRLRELLETAHTPLKAGVRP